MSLSDADHSDGCIPPQAGPETQVEGKYWGTIFMGPGPLGETTLAEVSRTPSTAWDAATEALYLERVREKATAMAREVIDAARAEAESIRARARAQGHEDGLAQAQQELEEFRAAMGESAAAVLGAIQAQCAPVLAHWKEDLTAVLQLAVERTVGILLKQDRADILKALYLDALKRLDDHRQIIIRVNPEDEAAVGDIILAAKELAPALGIWNIKPDPSLQPGGLRIETHNSLADNSLEARRAAVEQILKSLELPDV